VQIWIVQSFSGIANQMQVLSKSHGRRGSPFWGWAAVAACGIACSAAALPEPGTAHLASARASEPEATLEDLQRGRGAYMKRCGSCHALRAPADHEPDSWAGEIERMRTKHQVRLSEQEAQDILRFLRVASAVARGPA